MYLVKVNKRTKCTNRVTKVKRLRAGNYEIETASHGKFTVDGGRACGGRRTDWFLEGGFISGTISVSSVMDAVNLIETA